MNWNSQKFETSRKEAKGGEGMKRLFYFIWALWRYKICYYTPLRWKYLREDEELFWKGLWE